MIEGSIVYNGIELNLHPRRYDVAPFWLSRVTSVDGLYGGVDMRVESYPRPNFPGERHVDSFFSARTVVLSGEIVANNGSNMRIGERTIESAFWHTSAYNLQFQLYGEPSLIIPNAYVSQPYTSAESWSSLVNKRLWSVQLKADDPRTYLSASPGIIYPSYMS